MNKVTLLFIFILIIIINSSRNVKLNYNRTASTIQLYNSKGRNVYFKLHFNNSDI